MKMNTKIMAAVVAAFVSSPAVAQVAASFDGLADDILASANAAMFSGAVNTADIDGSVTITGGIIGAVAGSTSGALEILLDGSSSASESVGGAEPGSATSGTNAIFEAAGNIATTTNNVLQEFGDVSSVAAGAISDSTFNLTETGATASAAINTATNATNFGSTSSNLGGSTIGVMQGALNTGSINGSITMGVANANVAATSVGSVAAGAINTGSISALFVGGNSAEASVTGQQ